MSKNPNEINDNEIRIISANEPEIRTAKRQSLWRCLFIIGGITILGGLCIMYFLNKEEPEKEKIVDVPETVVEESTPIFNEEKLCAAKAYINPHDTVVNKNGLLILSPENARPRLIVGEELLNDSNIILATQAADVRGDNGEIVGTFVLNGELISKGESKAGFCSIIDGELSIGVADATPMLEQTLTNGGYFFRQYPLVVGGQIVENKPKGRAIRKALAEIGGKICVVISKEKLTFHDFSQLLIDTGVRNAIYLVGSTAYGFYVNEEGERVLTGNTPSGEYKNLSFIIWE